MSNSKEATVTGLHKACPRSRSPVLHRPPITSGTFDYYRNQRGKPEGYASLSELADWPADLVVKMFSGPAGLIRRRRFENNLERGVVMHTDFSGKGSVETVMKILDKAAKDNSCM
jgi:hypothetical protein